MKLKIKKKMAEPEAKVEPLAKETKEKTLETAPASTMKIEVAENGQRRYNTSMFSWAEVFSTKELDVSSKVKLEFTRHLISVVVLYDFDKKDYVVFTTETFYSEARRLVLEVGETPWGVDE